MKEFFSKTSTVMVAVVIVILASGTYLYFALRKTEAYSFVPVHRSDITQTVNVSGAVQAAQEVALSFQQAGKIQNINVKVGDQVKKGQLLLSLDSSAANAAIAQAQAAVSAARASYKKIVDGATTPEIDVAKAAVESAQVVYDSTQKNYKVVVSQQQTAAANAYSAMLNAGLAAIPSTTNSSTGTITVSGTYNGTGQGQVNIGIIYTGAGVSYTLSGLENGNAIITRGAPMPIGDGLYLNFSSTGTFNMNDAWSIPIPNVQASTYLADYNAYQSALQAQSQAVTAAQSAIDSAKAALDQANAQLELKLSTARPEDIQSAQSAIDVALAQLASANNLYNNSVISAPFDGTITKMDASIGEQAGPGQNLAAIVSNQAYQINTYLSDVDYGRVKMGDQAEVTLDAYGDAVKFPATVVSIDQSATLNQNVPSYKTVLQFNNNDDRIKTGMNANVRILDETHHSALIVPQSAIITKNNQASVLVSAGKGKVQQQNVVTGIYGDGNIEITSGLSEGQEIVNFGK